MTDWEPIETYNFASGSTDILGFESRHRIRVIYFNHDAKAWKTVPGEMTFHPRFWMRFPEPPAVADLTRERAEP